jgi:hypothetical protein
VSVNFERLWCPIFSEGDYSPARAAERYKLYASDGTDVSPLTFSSFSLPILLK